MADLDPSILPKSVGGVLGWVVSTALFLFTAWTQFRKAKVDESALVLGKWREMTEQHARDLKEMRDELRAERAENAMLRETIHTLEGKQRDSEKRIRELEDEVKGLRRQMQQSAESAIHTIAQRPGEPIIQAAMAALDRVPEIDEPFADRPVRKRRRKSPNETGAPS